MHLWRFNLHKTNAANEELVISLTYGREVQEKIQYTIAPSLYSLSNKMDNSLPAVRDINHKYIVVERILIILLLLNIRFYYLIYILNIAYNVIKRRKVSKKELIYDK